MTPSRTDSPPLTLPPTEGPPFRAAPQAGSLKGSEILRIATEIRARLAAGERICNLTVGDFDPRQFRVPKLLEDATVEALRRGETNYPPGIGMPVLREAVVHFYESALGLSYSLDSVLITSGSRPGVYGTYRTLVGEGERVVYGVPSWNNNYYAHMVGAEGAALECTAAESFLPTRERLESVIRGARLLALNSPLNPAGTAFTAESLGAICDLVLEENARRGAAEGPLYVMYDHVYWQLTFGGVQHVNPVSLRPGMAPYTILVDGISKAFAATGMRVGWVVGPPPAIKVMENILTHVGTWAPRAEQLATATLLGRPDVIAGFRDGLVAGVQQRLMLLYTAIRGFRAAGHPVDATEPMGAIYLAARFDLRGKTTRDGRRLATHDDVRKWLLETAGLAVVPFDAFGSRSDDGWFRLSVGAVSVEDIEAALPRLGDGLASLT
ncbi:MAG: aminotransferase class I/II-fold pyridoxal phosphate-dependent enzyme [Gemmatimonadaceae bacterium]|nr:aminotransferase class I/II-fold pyridoxal phosphate-dependent enzyme [Gemmatimonadaceae bacterium]